MYPRLHDVSSTKPHPLSQDRDPTHQTPQHGGKAPPSLVVHISDMLGEARRSDLEHALTSRAGIREARFNPQRPHLLLVDYDPAKINSFDILQQVQLQHVRAQLIGPI